MDADTCGASLSDCDSDILESLSKGEREELARLMTRVDDDSAPSARLVRELGATDTQRLLSLSVKGVDNAQLRENLFRLYKRGDADADEISTFTRNIETFEDTKGIDDVLESLSSQTANPSNFKGASTELKIGSSLRRQDKNVVEFEREIQVEGMTKTDVDIVTGSDDLIEVKGGDFSRASKQSGSYDDLAEKMTKYDRYRRNNDLGDVEVHFTKKPHDDVIDMLDRKGAVCQVYSNGGWTRCR